MASVAGDYGFSGMCAPNGRVGMFYKTFSLGVFQWKAKAGGKGVKRGPVLVRVSGPCEKEEAVRERVQEIVKQLGAGTYAGPKRVTVK